MAHTCPDCGTTCYCGGDIDDICFGDDSGCECDCQEQDFYPDEFYPDDDDDRDYGEELTR